MALSDAAGDTVQTYEYSVYGEVAVEDANHPNPYMFAGVRYDIEIGLYYNRARYYNPFTGRFLKTDPIGYGAGMNMYAYCGNNPTNFVDPSGLKSYEFTIPLSVITDLNAPEIEDASAMVVAWLSSTVGFWDDIWGTRTVTDKFGTSSWEVPLYTGWRVDEVDVVGDEFVVTLVADDSDPCWVPPPPDPSFGTVSIHNWYGVQAATLDGVGILDDRLIGMIMGPKFKWIRSQPRDLLWHDWYIAMRNCATTPFRYPPLISWKYDDKIYSWSSVNYLGLGYGAAHFRAPPHWMSLLWRSLNRRWPYIWNAKYGHLPGDDQFWFDKGFALYP